MATVKRTDLLISTAELAGSDALERHTVIDCRFDLMAPEAGRTGYLEGHVPGAGYAHLDEDLAAPVEAETGRHPLPSPEALGSTLRRLGVSKDRPVVVYDESGGAVASRAWWLLRWAGHSNVRLLDGGLPAWRECGLALESGDPLIEAGDFDINPNAGQVLTTAELAARARCRRRAAPRRCS